MGWVGLGCAAVQLINSELADRGTPLPHGLLMAASAFSDTSSRRTDRKRSGGAAGKGWGAEKK